MTGLDAQFESALRAMEASFHVRLIGTFEPALLCARRGRCRAWLAMSNQDFDQFPVKQGDATVGILLRQGDIRGNRPRCDAAFARELMVSADMPIADLIPSTRQ